MKHEELAHVLRANAALLNETSFVLVGSQAVRLFLANGSVGLATLCERIALRNPAKNNLQYISQWTQRRAQKATE